MYTEGFEGLDEAEKSSRRAYVSSVSQEDADRILRENDRLKKSLEKEKFFNKLLDQEIQDLKNNNQAGQGTGFYSSYWSGNRGVSKRAFYSLLVITLAMAAYIGYGIYYDKQFNYLGFSKSKVTLPVVESGRAPSAVQIPATSNTTNSQAQTKSGEPDVPEPANKQNQLTTPQSNPPVKDSVPNIIGTNKTIPAKEKPPVVTEQVPEYDEAEVQAEIGDNPPAGPVDSRPVIAQYKVISKANFYNAPDENTMRSTYISQSPNKIVESLEEKNGFIFVVYTNDVGYTSKGWLSKKDLAKAE